MSEQNKEPIKEEETPKAEKKEVSYKDMDEQARKRLIVSDIINTLSKGYYGFQNLRIILNNQIRDIVYKVTEAIDISKPQDKKDKKDKSYGKYKDEEIIKFWEQLVQENKLPAKASKYMKNCLEFSIDMKKNEGKYKTIMRNSLIEEAEPIFVEFLSKVKGIAEISTTNLMKKLGNCVTPRDFKYVSRLWSYCGYSVIGGKAPKRKKGEKTTFDIELRSMIWNIGKNLVRSNKGFYRMIYDTEKQKQVNRTFAPKELFEKYGKPYKEEDIKLTLKHADSMALRKMIKIFLSHYWEAGRELAGQPIERQYVEAVLNHDPKDIVHWREALTHEDTIKKLPKKDKEAEDDEDEEENEDIESPTPYQEALQEVKEEIKEKKTKKTKKEII